MTPIVYQSQLQWIERLVLNLVGRPEGDLLDTVDDFYVAQKPCGIILRLGAHRENEFTLSVHSDASDLLPLFAYELQTNAAVCRR